MVRRARQGEWEPQGLPHRTAGASWAVHGMGPPSQGHGLTCASNKPPSPGRGPSSWLTQQELGRGSGGPETICGQGSTDRQQQVGQGALARDRGPRFGQARLGSLWDPSLVNSEL